MPSLPEAIRSFFFRTKDRAGQAEREEALRVAFKARCDHFKALLSANKRALVAMSVLEEAARGERFFSMSFVRANCTTVVTNVFNMVRHLDGLCPDAHAELFARLKAIQQSIADALAPRQEPAPGPLVLPLTGTGFSLAHEVGGKMASLGEAWRHLGQNIPPGFVVTAGGYRHFMRHNALREEIDRRIQMTDLSRLEEVFALSSSLQRLIMAAPVPDDLAREILEHAARIEEEFPDIRFAVRSSAIGEDAHGVSFAGQYHTELNVPRDMLLETYKEIIAGKYGVTAITYRVHRGIPDDEVPMCVGCLAMVDAAAGGVAYSRDPLHREPGVVINAVPGLPKAVVDGSAEVDVFRVSRELPATILHRSVPEKQDKLVCAAGEGIISVPLSEEEKRLPSLSDERIFEITRVVLGFEAFYGTPQDMEWAYTRDGRLMVLQSRPLPAAVGDAASVLLPDGVSPLLEGGETAAPGAGAGRVCIVRRNADMLSFPEGAVLVVEQAHSRWAPMLARAAAVVSEYGSSAGHLASVAREYGIPALFGLAGASRSLTPEELVTVDADARRVYPGMVEEALARKRTAPALAAGSPVYETLRAVSQYIVPLHLLDPRSPEFVPACCRTLHDITRYCHEKAVEEMFRLDASLFSERCGKQLTYKGGRLQYFIVNLENGFCGPVEGGFVDIEQICSLPMLALWEGMLAVPWAGPPQAGARGFLAVVAQSAANPELEVTSPGMMARNYCMVDKEYCNLQARFGYHFCTVEAQTGERNSENYVSFHFKGGAADIARRQQRVRVIADLLESHGFIVDVKEDALSARAEELPAGEALALLKILGFLLIHSRQADAALHGEAAAAAFAATLRNGLLRVRER